MSLLDANPIVPTGSNQMFGDIINRLTMWADSKVKNMGAWTIGGLGITIGIWALVNIAKGRKLAFTYGGFKRFIDSADEWADIIMAIDAWGGPLIAQIPGVTPQIQAITLGIASEIGRFIQSLRGSLLVIEKLRGSRLLRRR